MPILTIQQSPRDLEPKRRLVAGITRAFVDAYGVRPEQVQVFIHSVDHENWAKGGKLAFDADARCAEAARRSPGLALAALGRLDVADRIDGSYSVAPLRRRSPAGSAARA